MNEDYLWDRCGEPDPEVAHLEKVLGALAHRKPRRARAPFWIAAAAVLLAGIATAVFLHEPPTSWRIARAGEKSKPLHTGETVETAADRPATIQSEFIGKIDLEPNSRLRVLPASGEAQRLSLERGVIHALIWAPPTKFVVDTPAAKAVDLGCAYTLQVGSDGSGLLNVEIGWVAFQWRDLESFIPAGAACRTRIGHGPDTPYFRDAAPDFQRALSDFDRHGSPESLRQTLRLARARDGLTLWHLLQRTHADQHAEVLARFQELVPMPPDPTLDQAWNALHLGETSWWREWKRPY